MLLAQQGTSRAAMVQNLRIGQFEDSVRIVLDLTENSPYTAGVLRNPTRLVIDLERARIDGFNPAQVAKNSTLIRDVRFGRLENEKLRIVVELGEHHVIRRNFVLKPHSNFPWRLVVDLVKESGAPSGAGAQADRPPGDIAVVSPPVNAVNTASPRPDDQSLSFEDLIRSVQGDGVGAIIRGARPVIVLDPGHGGRDPGAIGVSGIQEKTLTLQMALEIKRRLDALGKYDVHLTRSDDRALSLRARRQKAMRLRADLFISIHADSHRNPQTRGLSVYTVSERASDAEAKALAESENRADIVAGLDLSNEPPEVSSILIDLARRESMNRAAIFASLLVTELSQRVTILRNPHRFAGFAVLKAPDVPSVLLEMGYLSNPDEERLLRQPQYRARLAESVVNAIEKYFAK
ncbi:MAG: N-acetylmuramoyl-L-alanine amidase [Alphaproteobacteria bacterium]|nr:N-acetylmuramoyl-L-alanine amidase [Alphaproteobacteria bacterium]